MARQTGLITIRSERKEVPSRETFGRDCPEGMTMIKSRQDTYWLGNYWDSVGILLGVSSH